jgi:hypothetical protein
LKRLLFKPEFVRRAAKGAVLGVLAHYLAYQMGLLAFFAVLPFPWPSFYLAVPLFAALMGLGFRKIVWILSGAVAVLYTLVAFTPVFVPVMRAWPEVQAPVEADAIMVLHSDVNADGTIDRFALYRLLRGVELVQDGWSDQLVMSHLGEERPSDEADLAKLLRALPPGVEVHRIGPVESTRDEARVFGEFARERGWRRVLLVTTPMHSRRQAAIFRKTGLEVVSVPSHNRDYSPDLRKPRERVAAFRHFVEEGYRRLRT